MLRFNILILLLTIFPFLHSQAQDTSFYTQHHFPTVVNNVFIADGKINVKCKDGVYELNGKQWNKLSTPFTKTFVFYQEGYVETDHLNNSFYFPIEKSSLLVPQPSTQYPITASINDRLFLSCGGNLFEYNISKFYSKKYPEHSIRDIFQDDSIKIVSTYSGIFINDSIRLQEPYYSNGYCQKINNQYFICFDGLAKLNPPYSATILSKTQDVDHGNIRRLISYNNRLYAQNTISINQVLPNWQLRTLIKGEDFSDLISTQQQLFFSSAQGNLYRYDGKSIVKCLQLATKIWDINAYQNYLYLATDIGIYRVSAKDPTRGNWLCQLESCIASQFDQHGNLWITTTNGLDILTPNAEKTIPFITKVEFNFGALQLINDTIFAGSIKGLYVADTYKVNNEFISLYNNRITNEKRIKWFKWGSFFGLLLILILGAAWWLKKKLKRVVLSPNSANRSLPLTLEEIKQAIIDYKIISVEQLADFFETNTVQLNRKFKNFETTPGKFLKQVKLNYAQELLHNQIPIAEVAETVGFSLPYLKAELHSMQRRTPKKNNNGATRENPTA